MGIGLSERQLAQALDLIENHIGKGRADNGRDILSKVLVK